MTIQRGGVKMPFNEEEIFIFRKEINSDSFILVGIEKTINSNSKILAEYSKTINSDLEITRKPQNVTNVYVVVDESNTTVYGNIPETVDAKIHIEVTVNGNVYSSDEDVGFEYWDDDSWETYPAVGLDTKFGNQFKYNGSIVSAGKVSVRGFAK